LTFLVRLLILPGMKRLLGGLLTAIALSAANFTVCAETDQIDLKALAKKARPAVMLLVISDANGKEIATGTGFLVSADGKLITNFHVIEKAASAVAKTENGGLFPVEGVLASDPKNDLVLLKIKGKELPFLTLSNSENIEVGTRIVVIGSPLGLEGTLSEGIVSAVRELMGDTKRLQITALLYLWMQLKASLLLQPVLQKLWNLQAFPETKAPICLLTQIFGQDAMPFLVGTMLKH